MAEDGDDLASLVFVRPQVEAVALVEAEAAGGGGEIADFGLPFESLRALSMVEGRIERRTACGPARHRRVNFRPAGTRAFADNGETRNPNDESNGKPE